MCSFLVGEEIMLLALHNSILWIKGHHDFHSTTIVSISLIIQNHLTQLICYCATKNANKITTLMAAWDCIAYIFFLAFIVYSLKNGGMRRKYTQGTHIKYFYRNQVPKNHVFVSKQALLTLTYSLFSVSLHQSKPNRTPGVTFYVHCIGN